MFICTDYASPLLPKEIYSDIFSTRKVIYNSIKFDVRKRYNQNNKWITSRSNNFHGLKIRYSSVKLCIGNTA